MSVSVAAMCLDPDQLCRAAEAATGLTDWGTPPFAEALDRLCRSAVDESGLGKAGLDGFAARLVDTLAKRLRLYADRTLYPEIATQVIAAPLIVTGLPRSGTTILHALLAQDPAVRSPLKWEIDTPSPPPRAASYAHDPRIAATQAAVEQLPAMFRAMHAMGAKLPEECNSIMMMALLSPNFGATVRMPGYMHWLIHEADMAPAFALHRHVLQHLQAFAPGSHWVLKSPPYLWWLDALMAAYPDARLVITHRDPAQVMASNASLIAFLRGLGAAPADPLEVGAHELQNWHTATERLLAFDTKMRIDTQYRDFIAAPIAVVETVYARFGLSLTDTARAAMTTFLAGNQQNKHGRHDYDPATYGLDSATLHHRFARYIATYAIPTR